MNQLPPSIRDKVKHNPRFRAREQRREAARKRGRTLPPGELPKDPHTAVSYTHLTLPTKRIV